MVRRDRLRKMPSRHPADSFSIRPAVQIIPPERHPRGTGASRLTLPARGSCSRMRSKPGYTGKFPTRSRAIFTACSGGGDGLSPRCIDRFYEAGAGTFLGTFAAARMRGTNQSYLDSAVVGSMTDLISLILFAGNPPCRACSRMSSSLGAM